jgi:hypothetical protein
MGAGTGLYPESAQIAVLSGDPCVATGLRLDLSFLNELRLRLDPALEAPTAPLIDPNEHSCGTIRPHGAGDSRRMTPVSTS